ncbi:MULTISPECIES: radical SAM protein [unclassified Bradyrhizobium]|uniref:radical SAM protein n=2 Tax=unclassified Bradyrhizobium TaxID=2631580 RepID=UPI0028F0A217|nr:MULTISPECIES: radical SAM protein [unclassified Bradyrhizobium]
MAWYEKLQEIEPLDDLRFDHGLVDALEAAARERALGPMRFYTPTFRAYASEELKGCGKASFPAFSITGGVCALNCDHCQAKILEPMIAATTPDELDRKVRDFILLKDLRGFLLSGGSNRRNEVPYDRFYPTIERLKRDFPHLRIAVHSALLDERRARSMEAAGVDVAMLDVIGSEQTIREVYHLDRPVADFEATLAALSGTKMQVVPHIVIGLHYGRLLGEETALDIVSRHPVAALILVVVTPIYAPPDRPFATISTDDVAKVLVAARQRISHAPVQLGCIRPAGRHKLMTDAYAVMAGFDGIAYPADGIVALARAIGRPVEQEHACCSIALDGLAGRRACAA